MSYLGSWKIDDACTFVANTHNASTGAATDADSAPSYRIFENETATPILTGSMALLDSSNTDGFYSEQITLSAANGFEKGKSYNIYISAAVNSVTGTMAHSLQIEAEVDANVVSDTGSVADAVWDEATSGHTTSGTFGEQLKTDVDAILADTADMQPKLGIPTGASISADVANIQSDTDNIQSRLPTSLSSGRMRADVGAISGDETAANNLELDYDGTGYNKSNSTIGTTTTNTDMRGTDNALLAASAPTNFSDLSITATTGRVDVASVEGSDATDQINAAVDAALDTAIPASPTANSINERIKSLDELTESGGSGDLAAILTDTADMQPKFGSPSGASISADIAENQTDLNTIITDIGNLNDPDAAAVADAVWDEATAGHTTAGTFGEQVKTDIDAILTDTADMQPKIGTPAGSDMSADIAAIQSDTDDIQTRLPAALVSGKMDSDVTAISGSTTAADRLEASVLTIVSGTAQTGTLSTTQMTSDLSEATDDHYNGRIIIWTSGVLQNQATDITDYSGTNGLLTFTAVTEAPSNGDTFIII